MTNDKLDPAEIAPGTPVHVQFCIMQKMPDGQYAPTDDVDYPTHDRAQDAVWSRMEYDRAHAPSYTNVPDNLLSEEGRAIKKNWPPSYEVGIRQVTDWQVYEPWAWKNID